MVPSFLDPVEPFPYDGQLSMARGISPLYVDDQELWT
jgi:hypothetical protein